MGCLGRSSEIFFQKFWNSLYYVCNLYQDAKLTGKTSIDTSGVCWLSFNGLWVRLVCGSKFFALRWVELGWVSRLVGCVRLKKLDPWTTLNTTALAARWYRSDNALFSQVGFLLDSGIKTTRPSSADPRDFLALIDLERYWPDFYCTTSPYRTRNTYACTVHLHCESKKQDTIRLPITSPNVNRFSKFLYWQIYW